MALKAPKPLAQAFIICRALNEDKLTGDWILIAPFNQVHMKFFPLEMPLSVFASLVDGHGTYNLSVQLRNAEGDTVWKQNWPNPVKVDDPLLPKTIAFRNLRVEFPTPGRFDMVLVADGEELARFSLVAILMQKRKVELDEGR